MGQREHGAGAMAESKEMAVVVTLTPAGDPDNRATSDGRGALPQALLTRAKLVERTSVAKSRTTPRCGIFRTQGGTKCVIESVFRPTTRHIVWLHKRQSRDSLALGCRGSMRSMTVSGFGSADPLTVAVAPTAVSPVSGLSRRAWRDFVRRRGLARSRTGLRACPGRARANRRSPAPGSLPRGRRAVRPPSSAGRE